MPSVSVIIPAYNRSGLLYRAINSVLNQTYRDLEIIVVDDCSTENIEGVVKAFSSERIKLKKHNRNLGTPAARNTAIKSSDSRFLAFLDNDDEWLSEKLEKQINALEEESPRVGIIDTGYMNYISGKLYYVPCFEKRNPNRNIYRNIIGKHFLLTSTLVIKRECFESAGLFDENMVMFEDWDLFLRIMKGYQIKSISEPLTKRYLQPDSISTKLDIVVKGYAQLVNKHHAEIKEDRGLMSVCYLKLGHMTFYQGNIRQGREYILRSLKASPIDIRPYAALVLSLPGKKFYHWITRAFIAIKGLIENS